MRTPQEEDVVYCIVKVHIAPPNVLKDLLNSPFVPDDGPASKRRGSNHRRARDATPDQEEPTLEMTINPESMKRANLGHVFGSDAAECDVLLDRTNLYGISGTHFRLNVEFHSDRSNVLRITSMTRNAVFVIDNAHSLSYEESRVLFGSSKHGVQAGNVFLNITIANRPLNKSVVERLEAARLAPSREPGTRVHQTPRRETPRFSHNLGAWVKVTNIPWRRGGDYKLGREILGSGRYSTVRKAVQPSDQSVVAVKIISDGSNPPFRLSPPERQSREIDIMMDLTHRNIVRLLDYAHYDAEPVATLLALDLAPHGLLRDVFFEPQEEGVCQVVSGQILAGLQYLHERNIIHRDINPSNILVFDRNLLHFHCKIADFTHAEPMTLGRLPGDVQGTAAYMSLECAEGRRCDDKADVFACGKVAVWVLTNDDAVPNSDPSRDPLRHIADHLRTWDRKALLNTLDLSPPCQDLLLATLDNDVSVRPSAAECLAHDWLSGLNESFDSAGREENDSSGAASSSTYYSAPDLQDSDRKDTMPAGHSIGPSALPATSSKSQSQSQGSSRRRRSAVPSPGSDQHGRDSGSSGKCSHNATHRAITADRFEKQSESDAETEIVDDDSGRQVPASGLQAASEPPAASYSLRSSRSGRFRDHPDFSKLLSVGSCSLPSTRPHSFDYEHISDDAPRYVPLVLLTRDVMIANAVVAPSPSAKGYPCKAADLLSRKNLLCPRSSVLGSIECQVAFGGFGYGFSWESRVVFPLYFYIVHKC